MVGAYCHRMDVFDDAAQPRCPEGGTVLRDAGTGFACVACGLVFLGTFPSPGVTR